MHAGIVSLRVNKLLALEWTTFLEMINDVKYHKGKGETNL
jgi:hypothetical protein